MIEELSLVVDPHLNFLPLLKFPHIHVKGPPDMSQPVLPKVFRKSRKEPNLLFQIRRFVGNRLLRDTPALLFGERIVVGPVLVEAAYHSPVVRAVLPGLPVQHVGIHTADGEAPVIYPALPVVVQVDATAVLPRPEGIAGDIKRPVLIACLVVWCGHKRCRVHLPGTDRILLQEKDVIIECPCAAAATAVAPKSDLGHGLDKLLYGVCLQRIKLLPVVVPPPVQVLVFRHLMVPPFLTTGTPPVLE